MVELFCVLVGVVGSIFSVNVEPSVSIARVKEAVLRRKEAKLRGAHCDDADELQLLFAVVKNGSGTSIRTQELQTPAKTNAKRKRDTAGGQWKSQLSSALMADKPGVVLHLRVSDKMVKLCRFSLLSDICWRSSADSDFAIFKEISTDVAPRRYVDVYGFQGALGEPQRSRNHGTYVYHVVITRIDGDRMTLVTKASNRALSPDAIVYNQDNVALGYIGEAFREVKPDMHQVIAYILHGIPRDLPSYLARSTK